MDVKPHEKKLEQCRTAARRKGLLQVLYDVLRMCQHGPTAGVMLKVNTEGTRDFAVVVLALCHKVLLCSAF